MIDQDKILVDEDDKDFREKIRDFLVSEGYAVEIVESISEFQVKAENSRFSLALLDINLTDGSGHHIARFLRNTSFTRIITLTARGAEADRLESYSAGADIHLLKPVSTKELKVVIEMLLARLEEIKKVYKIDQYHDFSLVVGGWTLHDMPSKLISPNGKYLELSVKDYLLIQQIMVKKGHMLKAEDILLKTKFTERLTSVGQLVERISTLNTTIESSLGVASPIKCVPDEGVVFIA